MAAATSPSPGSSTPTIVGSWYASFSESLAGGTSTTRMVLTFLNNGTYLLANYETGPEPHQGIELASYSWDATTDVLSSATQTSTGSVGIPKTGTNTLQVQPGGNLLLVIGQDGQRISLEPVLNSAGSIVGSWYSDDKGGGSDDVVVTFLANGTFFVADKGTQARDPNGHSGMEFGTYTWNASTGAATYTFTANTDGEWGFSNGGPRKLLVSGSSLLPFSIDGGVENQGPAFIRVSNAATASAGTTGTAGADTLTGTSGNDTLVGLGGNDMLDGGAGVDTASYSGTRANFTVTRTATGFTVTDKTGTEGTDTLINVERIAFSDGKLALDVSGNAGTTAKILGAVFGREAVANKTYAGIGLQLLDGGMSYSALMKLAIDARLGAGASNTAVVDLLYTNVVGNAPSASERALYVGLLESAAHSVGSLGVLAADTAMNQANVNLVGLAATGLEYS